MFWPDPTHQPTYPPTKSYTHPWVGKSPQISNLQTEISQLVQVLLNFDWFWECPPGGWVGGFIWVGGGKRVPPAHVHMHVHAHSHTCTYDIIGNRRYSPNGGGHLHEIMMFTMRACACMCVHMCGGHPPTTPRAAGSPKHQNSISVELIEIIRFCLKILYLWTFLNSYRL